MVAMITRRNLVHGIQSGKAAVRLRLRTADLGISGISRDRGSQMVVNIDTYIPIFPNTNINKASIA